jgi:hypothetical protein
MAKSKARFLADVLQDDGSSIFVGNFAVPADFVIDPAGSPTGLGNASLENSSITINSYDTALGSSVTLVTDDINEGGSPTNLYFTNARAQAAFTGGTGVTITSGEVAIGQSVETTDNVTFNQVTATVPYDNSVSGLTATNVQSAITELNTLLGGGNVGSQATYSVYEYTTAGNDTQFDLSALSPAGSYIPGYVQVYLNGLLLSESDYTAVDGSTINFSPAITNAGQLLYIIAYDSFNTAEILRVTSIDASASTNSISIDANDDVSLVGSLSFADNEKAIFGAGSDLQIYHDGNHSYIDDTGTGNLRILAGDLRVRNSANTEAMISATEDAAVTLFYDGSAKLATTSTGIDVTGDVVSDGLTVDGVAYFNANNINYTGSSPKINFFENDTTDKNTRIESSGSLFAIKTLTDDAATATKRFEINHSTGDITFYDADGTTASFVYDASAGLTINEGGADRDFRVESVNNQNMLFINAADDAVGINTGTPTANVGLTVEGQSDNVSISLLGDNPAATQGNRASIRFNADYTQTFEIGMGDNMAGGGRNFTIQETSIGSSTTTTAPAYMFRGNGDGRFYFSDSNDNIVVDLNSEAGQAFVFNENGTATDFRVESVSNANMLFVDASNDQVAIGTNSVDSSSVMHIQGAGTYNDLTSGLTLTLSNTLTGTASNPGNVGAIQFGRANSTNSNLGRISLVQKNASASTESAMVFFTNDGGGNAALREKFRIDGVNVIVNDLGLANDFTIESDNDSTKFFVDSSADEIKIGLGNDADSGVQFMGGGSERAALFYDGSQKVAIRAQSAPSGNDVDTLAIQTFSNNNYLDHLNFSRNGVITRRAGSVNTLQYVSRSKRYYYTASSNFDNPTVSILSLTTASTYPQAVLKITVMQHGLSANAAGYSHGYASLTYESSAWITHTQAFVNEYSNYGSAVPTWSLSTDNSAGTATVSIVCNRMTNYDTYSIEVEVLVGAGMSFTWS